MTTNCYDVKGETLIIVGTCLKCMQPNAYKELKKKGQIYELCLEDTHLNMAITKILGILCRVDVKKIIFASVDKSPHCIQMHYIISELEKAMDLSQIIIEHYVAIGNELISISNDTIKKSKSLASIEKDNIKE